MSLRQLTEPTYSRRTSLPVPHAPPPLNALLAEAIAPADDREVEAEMTPERRAFWESRACADRI